MGHRRYCAPGVLSADTEPSAPTPPPPATRDLRPWSAGRATLPSGPVTTHDQGMTRPLDVLVLENGRGGARLAVEELEAAGHRVHRCHDPAAPTFPCRGIEDRSACPLEGPVDVALLVRHHIHPHPSALEDGVSCAIRAGVPLVEQGPDILDPYAPWVTTRVGGEPVSVACERAIAAAFDPIVDDVLRRCAVVLDSVGVDPRRVSCRMEILWPRLIVHIDVPGPVSTGLREALAVRALDAVQAGRRSYSTINVRVHELEP